MTFYALSAGFLIIVKRFFVLCEVNTIVIIDNTAASGYAFMC